MKNFLAGNNSSTSEEFSKEFVDISLQSFIFIVHKENIGFFYLATQAV